MNKQLLKDSLGWGVLLWLFGYILGIVLFAVVPTNIIGWVIMPFGIGATLYVLMKKISAETMRYYVIIGFVWATIAVILDYVLLVQIFKPADGYYKLDVYIYYLTTLLLPMIVGQWKLSK